MVVRGRSMRWDPGGTARRMIGMEDALKAEGAMILGGCVRRSVAQVLSRQETLRDTRRELSDEKQALAVAAPAWTDWTWQIGCNRIVKSCVVERSALPGAVPAALAMSELTTFDGQVRDFTPMCGAGYEPVQDREPALAEIPAESSFNMAVVFVVLLSPGHNRIVIRLH